MRKLIMFKCKKCDRTFDKKQSLAAHHSMVHSKRKFKKKKVIKQCEKCNKSFTVIRTVYKLKGEIIPKKEKRFCSIQCANSRKQIKKDYYCLYCSELIKGRSKLYCTHEHRKNHKLEEQLKKAKKDGWWKITKKPQTVKKHYLYERGHQCEICKNKKWIEQPIPLVLDHIDGNSDNWSYNNLRLICRNCDGQLDTFAGRNIGKNKFKTTRMLQQTKRIKNGKQQSRMVV